MVTYSVMINSRLRGKFSASRRLWQKAAAGRSIAPYLFTLAVDILSMLVDRAVEVSLFNPLSGGRSNVKISHLEFADDSLFFSSREEVSLSYLSAIL